MSEQTLYPRGYGRSFSTMDDLERRYGPDAPIPAHPEFWRRMKAWLISRGGEIGIGGAYRFTQPRKPGFAPPGMSFHEKQRFASGFEGYSAIDFVVRNGTGSHRSPRWSEVPRQGSGHSDIKNYGIHFNINSEPWHGQCYEIDGYTSWRNRGRPDPQSNYPILGGGPPPITPPTGAPRMTITKHRRLYDSRERGGMKVGNGLKISLDAPHPKPSWAQAVLVNVTLLDVDGPTHAQSIWSDGDTSIVNNDPGGPYANANLAAIPFNGSKFTIQVVGGPAHVIVDHQGWAQADL